MTGAEPDVCSRWADVIQVVGHMTRLDPDFSAQLCVIHDGVDVLDIAAGPDLTPESITGVFSCTKAMAMLALATLIDAGLLDLDRPVSGYWPKFGLVGKAHITVRQALSHQAGVLGPPHGFAPSELSSRRGPELLETMEPAWEPGDGHGYHGLSIGIIMEELASRLTGRPLKAIFAEQVAIPAAADFYIGLPHQLESRYQPVVVARPRPPEPEAGLMRQALHIRGLSGGLSALPNNSYARRTGSSAAGGIGNARGMARIYNYALTGSLVRSETLASLTQQQVRGHDLVLGKDTRFGVVFQLPTDLMPFGGPRAFGHDGAGGCLGYADPDARIAAGFVCSPMSTPAGADSRSLLLAEMINRLACGQSVAYWSNRLTAVGAAGALDDTDRNLHRRGQDR